MYVSERYEVVSNPWATHIHIAAVRTVVSRWCIMSNAIALDELIWRHTLTHIHREKERSPPTPPMPAGFPP